MVNVLSECEVRRRKSSSMRVRMCVFDCDEGELIECVSMVGFCYQNNVHHKRT